MKARCEAFFPGAATKGNAQELRSAWVSWHRGLERVREHQDSPWPSAASPLGACLVPVEGRGMCLSLFPCSHSLAGQQLRAGRGAHSFPTHCVSFDLVKSTLSKAKLFGKKIKPDSLTN